MVAGDLLLGEAVVVTPRVAHHAGSAAERWVLGARRSARKSGMWERFIREWGVVVPGSEEPEMGISREVGLGKRAAAGGRRDGLLIGPHGDVALGASEDDAAVGGDAESGVWHGRCAAAYYHDVVGYEWGVILS